MKVLGITNNSSINFTGNIIDSHVHIGKWSCERADYQVEDVLDLTGKPLDVNVNGTIQKDDVKYCIVSTLDCLEMKNDIPYKDELNGNLDLLRQTKNKPSVRRLAVCQPGFGEVKNIKELFEDNPNKFIGLKFHPDSLNLPANSEYYYPYMEFAQENKLPCLFHCGSTNSNSCPKKIYELAKKFPDVPVILAHLGAGTNETNNKVAIDTLIQSIDNKDANLYCDISWVDFNNEETPALKSLIERLTNTTQGDKTDRILFGTDSPLGEFGAPKKKINGFYEKNIGMIKTSIKKNFGDKADELIENIFYSNAMKLYNIKDEVVETTKKEVTNSKWSKFRIGLAFAIGAAVVTGITYLSKKFAHTDTDKPQQTH